MTMKLKGLFYGKFVKQLFIISLISFFGLLGNSFVNARTNYNDISWLIYQPVDDREYLNDYSLLVDSDGDFESSYNSGNSQLVLYYPPNNGGNGRQIYGWINGRLYYYGDYNNQGVRQGFIKYFMHITKDLLIDVNNGPYKVWSGNLTADEFYSQDHSFSNIYSINTAGSSNAYLSVHYRTFCLEDSNGVDVYCWSCSSDTPLYNCNSQVENSQNFTITDFNDVFNIPYDFSPFVSSTSSGGLNPDSDKVYYSDNNQVYYDTFKAIGFNKDLCYSNFAVDDIVISGTYFSELFPLNPNFTGASVYDLISSWNSSLNNSFSNWYYWFYSRYNAVNKNNSPAMVYSLYSGNSKGNYSIFDKLLNNDFVDSYIISPLDYNTFCDMSINGYDPDGLFTGEVSTSFTNIFTNSCIRNGNCLDDGHFILSGANDLGYFSDDADIIDVFNSLYSQFKNAFKVDSSLSGTVGILPTYIIFGFFLFLLLYVFKR